MSKNNPDWKKDSKYKNAMELQPINNPIASGKTKKSAKIPESLRAIDVKPIIKPSKEDGNKSNSGNGSNERSKGKK